MLPYRKKDLEERAMECGHQISNPNTGPRLMQGLANEAENILEEAGYGSIYHCDLWTVDEGLLLYDFQVLCQNYLARGKDIVLVERYKIQAHFVLYSEGQHDPTGEDIAIKKMHNKEGVADYVNVYFLKNASYVRNRLILSRLIPIDKFMTHGIVGKRLLALSDHMKDHGQNTLPDALVNAVKRNN